MQKSSRRANAIEALTSAIQIYSSDLQSSIQAKKSYNATNQDINNMVEIAKKTNQ